MSTVNRLTQAFAAMVREVLPNVDFLGVYLYEVFSWNDSAQLAELKPVGNSKMPNLERVPPRLPGLRVKLNPGDQVLVGFENGDSSAPFIASLSTGAANTPALPVATQGSMVSTSVSLGPVLLPNGQRAPGLWSILLPFNPLLPPWTLAANAALLPVNAKLFGVTASGSLRVKTL